MSLTVVMGPMYAGKTSHLIQDYIGNTSLNKMIVDFDIRTRKPEQGSDVYISSMQTHDGIVAPCVYKVVNLRDLYNSSNYIIFSKDTLEYHFSKFESCEHIYINEAQFFDDLKVFVLHMLSYNKNVYIYGLDADYKQEKMGKIWDVIPFATHVKKITGQCSKCSARSIVSHRIVNESQVYLPDAQAYIPLCMKCYSVENDIYNIGNL